MFGYLILVDLPPCKIQIHGEEYKWEKELQGFQKVPQGSHSLTFIFPNGNREEMNFQVSPGEVSSWVWKDNRFSKPSPERQKYYRQMSLSGAWDDLLLDFPENLANPESLANQAAEAIAEKWKDSKVQGLPLLKKQPLEVHNEKTKAISRGGENPAQTDALDIREIQEKGELLYGLKTTYTEMDLVYLQEAIDRYLQNPSSENYTIYLEQLKKNLVLYEQMVSHSTYFQKLAEILTLFLEKREEKISEKEKKIFQLILADFRKWNHPDLVNYVEKWEEFLSS